MIHLRVGDYVIDRYGRCEGPDGPVYLREAMLKYIHNMVLDDDLSMKDIESVVEAHYKLGRGME